MEKTPELDNPPDPESTKMIVGENGHDEGTCHGGDDIATIQVSKMIFLDFFFFLWGFQKYWKDLFLELVENIDLDFFYFPLFSFLQFRLEENWNTRLTLKFYKSNVTCNGF